MTAGCKNWILTIEDKIAHPRPRSRPSSTPDAFVDAGWEELPEVFLSGALHGDERVGPTAVVEIASLLLESAWCESIPSRPSDYNDTDIMAQAATCRSDLKGRGVGDAERRWLSRLVTTRRIVIVPTANALGYDRKQRTEGGIDPNRDFPYDLEDATQCMRTVAGRTINEIFREHVFQLSVTFHGGMEAIA